MKEGIDRIELFGSTPTAVGPFTALVGWIDIENDPAECASVEILNEKGELLEDKILRVGETIRIASENWKLTAIDRVGAPEVVLDGSGFRVELIREHS